MLFTDPSLVDEFQTELEDITVAIAKLQARQITVLNQLERAGVASRAGARTMTEWTSIELDVSTGTAKELVEAANRLPRDPWLHDELAGGHMTLERAMARL